MIAPLSFWNGHADPADGLSVNPDPTLPQLVVSHGVLSKPYPDDIPHRNKPAELRPRARPLAISTTAMVINVDAVQPTGQPVRGRSLTEQLNSSSSNKPYGAPPDV
jgi:hypothetical protein